MRKLKLFLLVLILTILLGSCSKKDEPLEITAESVITMENLDDYLFRDDVQYVDLRNYSNTFKYGHILGFDNIPFFDYLDYRAFERNRTYEFNPDQLLDENLLLRLFEKDKAIFLYADGCIRSGYIKDALNYLGYERVFVIGGYYEYHGDNTIGGDGLYESGNTYYSSYTDYSTDLTYIMYGEFDVALNVSSLRFDVLDSDGVSVRYSSTDDLDTMLTILELYIDEEIYNFNEVYDDVNDTESDLYNLEGLNWTVLSPLIHLLEEQYR